MSHSETPSPMFAKASHSPGSRSSYLRAVDTKASIPRDAQPEAVLEEIRGLIADHLLAARRLAALAVDRFPDHSGIKNAHRILNQGQATVSSEVARTWVYGGF